MTVIAVKIDLTRDIRSEITRGLLNQKMDLSLSLGFWQKNLRREGLVSCTPVLASNLQIPGPGSPLPDRIFLEFVKCYSNAIATYRKVPLMAYLK